MPDLDSRSARYVPVTPMSSECLAAFNGPPDPNIYRPGRSPFAMVRVDEFERVSFCNEAADVLLGAAHGELVGLPVDEIFGKEKIGGGGGERWRKNAIRLRDGSLRALEISVMPMRRGAWLHLRLPTLTAV